MSSSSSKKSTKNAEKAKQAQAELTAQKEAMKAHARTWQVVEPRQLESNAVYIAARRYDIWAHDGDEDYMYGFMSTGDDGQRSRFMRIERLGVTGKWVFYDEPIWWYAADPNLILFYKLQFQGSGTTASALEQIIYNRGSDRHLSEDQQRRLANLYGFYNSRIHTIAVLHDLAKAKLIAMLGDEEDMMDAIFHAAETFKPLIEQANQYGVVCTPDP